MCCGNKAQRSTSTPASVPAVSWVVNDAEGSQVAVKTSEVAAKLHAARIGGSVEKRTV